jgi:hypothetical protein
MDSLTVGDQANAFFGERNAESSDYIQIDLISDSEAPRRPTWFIEIRLQFKRDMKIWLTELCLTAPAIGDPGEERLLCSGFGSNRDRRLMAESGPSCSA